MPHQGAKLNHASEAHAYLNPITHVFHQISRFHGEADEFVAAFVFFVASVAFHPIPLDFVRLDGGIEALPEVSVEDGFFVRFPPASFFPAREPIFADGID